MNECLFFLHACFPSAPLPIIHSSVVGQQHHVCSCTEAHIVLCCFNKVQWMEVTISAFRLRSVLCVPRHIFLMKYAKEIAIMGEWLFNHFLLPARAHLQSVSVIVGWDVCTHVFGTIWMAIFHCTAVWSGWSSSTQEKPPQLWLPATHVTLRCF